jgi:hypothetical protein
VDVLGSQRAPAANSQLAVAIFVFSRKATRAALHFAVINSSCSVRIGVESAAFIFFLSFL